MRQRVDRQRIELFLQRIGREFSKPGRIYLVGGTTMVYEGLRQQTLDIDLALEIFDEILQHYATDSLKQDPVEFQRKFAVLLEMWRELLYASPFMSEVSET